MSTRDFVIDISRAGEGCYKFELSGPGGVDELAQRQVCELAPDLCDRLRFGVVVPPELHDITDRISKWVLGTDLGYAIKSQLAQEGAPLRLIWKVPYELLPELSELPFELIRPKGVATPYITNPKISAFIHHVGKVCLPNASVSARSWPLRCLIVRANPFDLGGGVPQAVPICAAIRKCAPPPIIPHLELDILSAEQDPAVKGPATFRAFERQLRNQVAGYDLLVYLGHGDVQSAHQGASPVGILQFEGEDDDTHDPVASNRLSFLMQMHPVPVVILMGCLTAADVKDAMKDHVKRDFPQWLRGSQGVAQAMINSESGVHVTVGMRYRIEAGDAEAFLARFFESLLADCPGNVEMAVHAARQGLYIRAPDNTAWVAPMLFRDNATKHEPVFEFLKTPPAAPLPQNALDSDAERQIYWRFLPSINKASIPDCKQQIADCEAGIVAAVEPKAFLLMPALAEAVPEQSVDVPVRLYKPLNVNSLDGRVVVDGGATVESLHRSEALGQLGYQILTSADKQEITFSIRRPQGGPPIPAGDLFEVRIRVGPAAGVICPVTIDRIKTEPTMPVCAFHNVVVVYPP